MEHLIRQKSKKSKNFSLFEIIYITHEISKKATTLVQIYAKGYNLDIPDSFIASTALITNAKLFTYNIKDFHFIEGIQLI